MTFKGSICFVHSLEKFNIWIFVPISMKFMGFIKISEVFVPINYLQLCFYNHDIPRYADNSFSSSLLFLSLSYARVQLSSSCSGSYIYILFHSLYQTYTNKKMILKLEKDIKMTVGWKQNPLYAMDMNYYTIIFFSNLCSLWTMNHVQNKSSLRNNSWNICLLFPTEKTHTYFSGLFWRKFW